MLPQSTFQCMQQDVSYGVVCELTSPNLCQKCQDKRNFKRNTKGKQEKCNKCKVIVGSY